MDNNNLKYKKEQIVECYSNTFDKDMAYQKVGLTPEEIELLDRDEEFQSRLNYFLIEEREKIITRLRAHMSSPDDKISFKATVDMGKILYPSFFEGLKEPTTIINNNNNVNTKEEDDRLKKEYGHLLNGKEKVVTTDE